MGRASSSASTVTQGSGWSWGRGCSSARQEQLRRTSEDQEAALRMVSPDMVGRKRGNEGGQVFIDITGEEHPNEPPEGTDSPRAEDESRKRAGTAVVEEIGAGEPASMEGVMPASMEELFGEEEAETEAEGGLSMESSSPRRESTATTTAEPEATTTTVAESTRWTWVVSELPERRSWQERFQFYRKRTRTWSSTRHSLRKRRRCSTCT